MQQAGKHLIYIIVSLVALSLTISCSQSDEQPALVNDEIIVAGQRFAIGTPVVTWLDAGGYNAYLEHRHFEPDEVYPSHPVDPGNPKRYSQRRKMSAALKAKVDREGWTLDNLREQVDKFVYHYDACGTSARCFKALQDIRGLSVQFMLDLDGTIYQTLDLKERAWHAGNANCHSVGIEIANIGAYSEQQQDLLDEWYLHDNIGPYIVFPDSLAPELAVLRTPKFVARPARKELISGRINGRDLIQYDYTDEQYAALIKLTAALVQIFPKITLDAPRNRDGTIRMDVFPKKELTAYSGLLGHQHVTKGKVDPGPAFDWQRVIEGAQQKLNAQQAIDNQQEQSK